MTIADWCILAAVLLYLLTLAPIKALGDGDFKNSAPRDPGGLALSGQDGSRFNAPWPSLWRLAQLGAARP